MNPKNSTHDTGKPENRPDEGKPSGARTLDGKGMNGPGPGPETDNIYVISNVTRDYQPADGTHPVVVECIARVIGIDERVADEVVNLQFFTSNGENLDKDWWRKPPLPLQVYDDPACTSEGNLVTNEEGVATAYIVCNTNGEETYYVRGYPGGRRSGGPTEIVDLREDPKVPIHFTKP